MVDKKSHRWGRIVLGLILKVGFEEGSEPFGVLEVNTAAGGGPVEQFSLGPEGWVGEGFR